MAQKTTRKKKTKKTTAAQPSMSLYRNIALGFVLLTFTALVVIVYASLVQATIYLTPLEQQVSDSFLLDVAPDPVGEGLQGTVVSQQVEIIDTFSVQSDVDSATAVEGQASGIVTITNNRPVAQSLVATTRFLNEEGVLFRLDEGVTVPAGGSVEARITADEPGAEGDVAAGRFTIPGLSESLQDLVFGETTEPMTGGLRYVNVLTQTDIDGALNALELDVLTSAEEDLRRQVQVFDQAVFTAQLLESELDTEIGTEMDRFELRALYEVVGVFYDESTLFGKAETQLFSNLSRGLEPVEVSREGVEIDVERYDLELQEATFRVRLSGLAVPSAANDALARGVFSGMTEEEVRGYFIENALAKDARVEIRPGWLKRVPQSLNKIRIVIES